ncbi:rubredoxin [Salmonirosea aquatica]|uniref:Rubredoxin n=1 Tax=Salmonirosea aquatica TaxID=2654236 RepID=A0A7C9FZ53_9BACT|nr:rubredoxin [Cytophagaceae bacterium SJW1-29]
MQDIQTIKINLPGGMVSPGRLREILTVAYDAKVQQVRFGSRQQLIFRITGEKVRFLERDFKKQKIRYEINGENYPNIVSSYCAEEVFRTGHWLHESEYHTVLDGFDYSPKLKINLSDSHQSFTPFFTGNLNFIASPEPHFWYLYIRPKQSNSLFRWRDLIYTNDIAALAHTLEPFLLEAIDEEITERYLYEKVSQSSSLITQPATQEVPLPDFGLPYYEGFNRYGQRSWLGIYRRNEEFSIPFLLDICSLCLETRVGEICTTPWKSLIIKGIEENDRPRWSQIMSRHNINVRHAANELAWQTEDHDDEGIEFKKYILQYFEKHDTRTFGLCFGVQTRDKSEVFGSILIRKRYTLRVGDLRLLPVYDLFHTDNFNPNSRTYFLFETGLMKNHLPNQVDRLCRKFNASRYGQQTSRIEIAESSAPALIHERYQCPHCLTVYDETFGDERAGIAPGVPFSALPDSYLCATCEAPKTEFAVVEIENLVV